MCHLSTGETEKQRETSTSTTETDSGACLVQGPHQKKKRKSMADETGHHKPIMSHFCGRSEDVFLLKVHVHVSVFGSPVVTFTVHFMCCFLVHIFFLSLYTCCVTFLFPGLPICLILRFFGSVCWPPLLVVMFITPGLDSRLYFILYLTE